jgi:hypothetical protein
MLERTDQGVSLLILCPDNWAWRPREGITGSLRNIFWLRFVQYFTSKGYLDRWDGLGRLGHLYDTLAFSFHITS